MNAAAKKTPKTASKAGKSVGATKASAPKPAAKAAPKASPKTKASSSVKVKPAAKSVSKTPSKAGAATKTGSKSAAKTKPAVSKKPAAKAPVKAATRAATKPTPKAAPKAQAPTKTPKASAKPVAKPVTPAQAPIHSTSAKQAAPAPAVAAPANSTSTLRKPASSRKSSLMAPPAPTLTPVTGAKASFLPNMSVTIAPPPQIVVKKDPKLANNWKTKDASALTDAEVLAMPDGEYMNDKQMAFFRLKLLQLKQDILNSADETTEHLREDTVIVPDPADRATIEEEHALELRTRDRERKLLKKIEQSISRIEAGDYGYCDETGEPIGVGRLLARPTATLSLEAQQRRELKQRLFGD